MRASVQAGAHQASLRPKLFLDWRVAVLPLPACCEAPPPNAACASALPMAARGSEGAACCAGAACAAPYACVSWAPPDFIQGVVGKACVAHGRTAQCFTLHSSRRAAMLPSSNHLCLPIWKL